MTLAAADSTLETDRLVMRRITYDDLPFYTRIQADPDVARFIGQGTPRSDAESVEWMEKTLLSYRLVALGQLAVIRKSDGLLIGRAGLSHLEVELPPYAHGEAIACQTPGCMPAGIRIETLPELGYTFDRAAWGFGYAREAVGALYEYSLNSLRITHLVSLIHPDNARSLKLAQSFAVTHKDRVRTGVMVFDRYVWPAAPRSAEGSSPP